MSQQSETQEPSRQDHYQQLDKYQRRQTRRYVLFPFLLLIVVLILIVVIMMSLRTPTQVAVVSDFLVTLFVLCPLVICLFPLVMLMFFLIALMSKLHSGTKSPLRRIESWTHKAEQRVEKWTQLADNRILNWAVRLAPIHKILTIFDEPTPPSQEGGQPDGTTETR